MAIDKTYMALLQESIESATDYAIETHMSGGEILECLIAAGADDENSVFHNNYLMLKEECNY